MSSHCPSCGFANPDNMRFCGQCGARLEVEPVAEGAFGAQKLGVMMGSDLLARFRRAGLEAAGQRRTVTVLFADIAGYTDLSARIDGEDLYALLEEVLAVLASAVYKYEGAVDKFTGDGLMALFGAPLAQENNAERALYAALEMQAAVNRLGAGTQQRLGGELRLHIGLHSGTVIVGPLGSNKLMNYTAVGDTVNLARRLEEASAPGTILVSEAVCHQTRALFDFEPIAPLALKGMRQPVPAYRLVGLGERPGSARGLEGLRAPMIGRQSELEALAGWAAGLAAGQSGRCILLTGEAGLGKSRLLAELRASLAGGAVRVIEGRSLTYRRSAAYWLFVDLLRNDLGVTRVAAEAELREALQQRVAERLGPNGGEALPYLERLLSLRPSDPGSEERLRSLDADRLRQQTFLAVRELLVAEARHHPLLILLEDLHWADEVSLDLLESLLDALGDAPLMLVVVSRPEPGALLERLEAAARPRLDDRFARLALQSLTPDEGARLLGALLSTADLPQALSEQILRRSAGVPFFLEEILRMLIDAGVLRNVGGQWRAAPGSDLAAAGVPETLQGLILARFDRLSELQRRVLQVAAVIGRQFSERTLTAVFQPRPQAAMGTLPFAAADEQQVAAALANLVEHAFVAPLGPSATSEYEFMHSLVSDAIYSTLLRRDRGELHGLVGEALEVVYASQLDAHVEILARHFAWSPRLDRALHYLMQAGQKAARGYAIQPARAHFEQAVELLAQVAHTWEQALEAHKGLGHVLLFVGDYDAAREHFLAALVELQGVAGEQTRTLGQFAQPRSDLERLISRTHERQGNYDDALVRLAAAQRSLEAAPGHYPVEMAQILNDIGWIHFRRGNLALARQNLTAGLALVEGSSAFEAIASIYNRLGGLAYSQGDWSECASFVRKSIAIREALGDVVSLANSLNNLGVLELELGQYDSALENLGRSYDLKRRQGQADGQAVALNNLGLLRVRRGELPEAEAALAQARAIAQQIGYTSLLGSVLMHLGELHLAAQAWAPAREALLKGVELFRELDAPDQLAEMYRLLGEVALETEDWAEARNCQCQIEAALSAVGDTTGGGISTIQRGEYRRFCGRTALFHGDWASAQSHLREAEAIFRGLGNRFYQGRAAYDHGLLAARQGEPQRAQLHFREAAMLFRSVGARLDARRAEAALTMPGWR